MASILGAKLSAKDMKIDFPHPSDVTKTIKCILDPCHALKLIRNTWSSMRVIYNPDGKKIDWSFIEKLVTLQETEGLHAGNKLRKSHLEWRERPMKVNIAAQTLSASVADAIDFCRSLNLKGFEDSEDTTEFIRIVDTWFDILNSRNPHGRGNKAPMKTSNRHIWEPVLQKTIQYINNLTWGCDKNLMVEHKKKTGFLGVIISSISVVKIFDEIRTKNDYFKYLLTYKVSQDHIELFFNAVRARGGWCVNPTPRHFSAAYKKLLAHHQIKTSVGNVVAMDNTEILFVTRTKTQRYSDTLADPGDTLNITYQRKFDTDFEDNDSLVIEEDICTNLADFDDIEANELISLEMPPNYFVFSEYTDNAIGLIAGYVVRMVGIQFYL